VRGSRKGGIDVGQPEQWERVCLKLELKGESLTRPPKGFDANHPVIVE
jgi:hypothetical protein